MNQSLNHEILFWFLAPLVYIINPWLLIPSPEMITRKILGPLDYIMVHRWIMYAERARDTEYINIIWEGLINRFGNTTKRFLVINFLVTVLTTMG